MGLKEIDLILPGLFFLEMLGMGQSLGTVPVNQADKKACAKGPFSEKQKAAALRTTGSLPAGCALTTLLRGGRAVRPTLIGLDCH